jgi:translation initiation factor IF-2
MAIRVRELAKEFKISSSALMKHLKDMGEDIKSPMSKIEDDIEIKIRARFNAEKAAVRQRELDRRNYQQKVVQTRKQESIVQLKSKPQKPAFEKPVEHPKKWTEHTPKKEPAALKPAVTQETHPEEKPQKPATAPPQQQQHQPHQPQQQQRQPQQPQQSQQQSATQQRQRPPRRTGSTAPERTTPQRSKDTDSRAGDNRAVDSRPRDNRPSYNKPAGGRPGGGGGGGGRTSQSQNYGRGVDSRQGDNRSGQQQRKPAGGRPDSRPYQGRPADKGTSDNRKPFTPGRDRGRKPGADIKITPFEKSVEIVKTDRDLLKKEPKKKKEDFGQKDKHIQAKIKNFKKGARKKKLAPTEIEESAINKNIKKTLASTPRKKRYKKDDKSQQTIDTRLTINEFTSVSELSKLMEVKSSEIIGKFFMMGKMVTINQRLDKESLELICSEFDREAVFAQEYGTEILQEDDHEREQQEMVSRPPIVTIMGHVDHGKTAILDHIRSTNVIAGESGGITQHIGAYQVVYNGHKITFLDTPGHEAFTAMRARGADVTDIAIIVVSASESVKLQTVEAIDHARAAGVTIIVAINKIDLPDANIDRTINDLMKQNLLLENYGGEVLWVTCSAKTGEGIDDLLESIILASEMQEITVPAKVKGKGVVIESRKDARMGTMATVLLQEGKLKKSDYIVCGATYGKIRKIEDERNNELKKIGPSDVGVIFGLNDVPKAGDIINFVNNEKTARQISTERKLIRQERENYLQKTNLDNLFQRIKDAEMAEIKIIVKADTDGSVEALSDSFMKLSNEEVSLNIIRKAVGGINDADVSLASASDAIIIGFHVRASNTARKLADDEHVEIKIYQIIYEAIEDIQKAMVGMMAPVMKEQFLGHAVVREVFKIKKVGQIAGCRVEKGAITKDALLRLFRNDIMVHEGSVSSLKHYAEDVKEVKAGSECGIGIEQFNDIKEGDVIEAYQMIEVAR